jgi:hypothetical protein
MSGLTRFGRKTFCVFGDICVLVPRNVPAGFGVLDGVYPLVSQFRSSHHCAAHSFANFESKGHENSMILVRLFWM